MNPETNIFLCACAAETLFYFTSVFNANIKLYPNSFNGTISESVTNSLEKFTAKSWFAQSEIPKLSYIQKNFLICGMPYVAVQLGGRVAIYDAIGKTQNVGLCYV